MIINVLCNAPQQLEAVLETASAYHLDNINSDSISSENINAKGRSGLNGQGIFGEIMIEAVKFPENDYKDIVRRCHEKGCRCRLALPYIFRDSAERWFGENKRIIADARFDGYLVRSLSEFSVVQEILEIQDQDHVKANDASDMQDVRTEAHIQDKSENAFIKTDYNMYAMNAEAKKMFRELGANVLTAPVELNERELYHLDVSDMEILVFGRIPMMISAQCPKNAIVGCKNRENVQIKDRTGKSMPVENVCRLCYNIIYNSVPLSMAGISGKIAKLSVKSVRLSFTTEDKAQCRNILKAYTDAYGGGYEAVEQNMGCSGRSAPDRRADRGGNGKQGRAVEEPVPEYTRGHFSRGVE
jgi:U32 family peptidase